MTIEALRQKAKQLPNLPGVYMMKDSLENIIYVGKSKELKKRVSSYFRNTIKEHSKVKRLVSNIASFDYEVTDTELDALLLECSLIKKLKPPYNSLLKNDRRYRFIKINRNTTLPRAEVAYEKEEEGEFFGPYDIPYRLITGVEAINTYYQLPTCSKPVPRKDCLAYRMKQCIGPCEEEEAVAVEYSKRLASALSFLEKQDSAIILHYEKQMKIASENLNFEKAGQYRNYLAVLKALGLRKAGIQFSLDNKKGVALIKIPIGGVKLYVLVGTQILYTQCFEMCTSMTQEEQKQQIVETILTVEGSCFEKKRSKRKHLEKAEVDEALITYYYFKTKSEVYYESFNEEHLKKSKKEELERIIENGLNKILMWESINKLL